MNLFDKLPQNIKDWMYGPQKNLAGGYIRPINADYVLRFYNVISQSPLWHSSVPFSTTVFGDVLAWDGEYIILYKFTDNDYRYIMCGTDFFFRDIENASFQKDYFDMSLYKAALAKFGKIDNDHSYTLEPLPKLGGKREEKYLNVGEMLTYLILLTTDIL